MVQTARYLALAIGLAATGCQTESPYHAASDSKRNETAARDARAGDNRGLAPTDSVDISDRDVILAALERLPEADSFFSRGLYAEAGEVYVQVIEQLPPPRHAPAVSALLRLKTPRNYLRLVSSLFNNLGLCHLRGRRFQLAHQMFEKALALDHESKNARSNLGNTLVHLKRFPQAIRELEAVRTSKIQDAKVHLDLGRAYLGAGEYARARWAFSQAMRLANRQGDVQGWGTALEAEKFLAEAYECEHNLGQAEHHLRQVLRRANGEVQARYRLCQILARQRRTKEADEQQRQFEKDSELLATIQSLLAENPDHVSALQWIADTYRKMGLLHLAEVHYRQLIARDPRDNQARIAINNLGLRLSQGPSANVVYSQD